MDQTEDYFKEAFTIHATRTCFDFISNLHQLSENIDDIWDDIVDDLRNSHLEKIINTIFTLKERNGICVINVNLLFSQTKTFWRKELMTSVCNSVTQIG